MSRHREEEEVRSVQMSLRLTPATRQRLNDLLQPGENTSDALRRLINTEWESQK